ncbi:acyl-CoA thioesterase [Pseudomonas sp. Marseille-Q5115]|uniref:acyl-CoA thioesterase n=1 Tax=Pseudomonas sp. Marseille-Q5115 TaxID=2866593 RepID=UPI001CE3D09F|nr:thioesterase family protein [Pseudomonas sp. Marseille-Q5115]
MTARSTPLPRGAFSHWQPIQTRWADNDCYGHVNNVVYYSWFDTAVNRFLLEQAHMKQGGDWLGLVVHTHCDYFASVAFPQALEIGLRVASQGTSSVRYELALFPLDSQMAAAQGQFVHVYVDGANRRPLSALPASLRAALLPLSPANQE